MHHAMQCRRFLTDYVCVLEKNQGVLHLLGEHSHGLLYFFCSSDPIVVRNASTYMIALFDFASMGRAS
jgi:hypothetical protein